MQLPYHNKISTLSHTMYFAANLLSFLVLFYLTQHLVQQSHAPVVLSQILEIPCELRIVQSLLQNLNYEFFQVRVALQTFVCFMLRIVFGHRLDVS